MHRFFSSTCFRLSGAAQQLGFWNFTSGSVWKWRLQWRNSGSPIERSVAHGTLISVPRYVVTHTVFENIKMAAPTLCRNKNGSVASLACLFPGHNIVCFSLPDNFLDSVPSKGYELRPIIQSFTKLGEFLLQIHSCKAWWAARLKIGSILN